MREVKTPPSVSIPRDSGRHVQQQQVLDVAAEHSRLDRGAQRHHLIRVHALVRFRSEDLLGEFLNPGNPGRTAHQHDFVNAPFRKAGILQRLEAGLAGALEEISDERLELRP